MGIPKQTRTKTILFIILLWASLKYHVLLSGTERHKKGGILFALHFRLNIETSRQLYGIFKCFLWYVTGRSLKWTSEGEIITQRFREYCKVCWRRCQPYEYFCFKVGALFSLQSKRRSIKTICIKHILEKHVQIEKIWIL